MVYKWRLTYVLSPSTGSRGKTGVTPSEHKIFKTERIRIDYRKNLKIFVKIFQIFIKFLENFQKISYKLLKYSINSPKVVQTLTNFSQITIINLI